MVKGAIRVSPNAPSPRSSRDRDARNVARWLRAPQRRLRVEPLESRWLLAANQFAVIGDYGADTSGELAVANMVKSWDPAYVITTGDNNYEKGAAATIDRNIGKYYQEFIGNYTGSYGPGSPTNRFFPSLGNHDWETPNAQPYLDYFTLPGNERYYDFVQGPIHFFVVDSDTREPHGTSSTSRQGDWLREGLAASTSQFNIVYFHHAPYVSHGASSYMRWPFKQWGADGVLAGHVHDYERTVVDGVPYFVVGNGGDSAGSVGSGAVLVTVEDTQLTFESYVVANGGRLIDSYDLTASTANEPTISISDRSVNETDAGTVDAVFTLTLSSASSDTVTVRYATADQTATAPGDYSARSGTVTFNPGVTTRTIAIPVKGDTLTESDETFVVELSNSTGATLGDSVGLGTIVDNDNDTATVTYHLSIAGSATLRSSDGSQLAVTDADIFRLDVSAGGAFQFLPHFDGSDVGLTGSNEDIDAFDLLPDGSIVISTIGSFSVATTYNSPASGSGATLSGSNRDLLKFTPATLGDNTTGSWSLFLIGASVDLNASDENIDAISVLLDGRLVLSTSGSASLPGGVAAKDEDLLVLTPSTGAWALYFDGSDVGLDSSNEDVDGLFIEPSTSGGDPALYFTTRDKFSVAGLSGADEDIFRFNPSQLGATTLGTFNSTLTLDGSAYGLAGDLDGMHIGAISVPAPVPAARSTTAVDGEQSGPLPFLASGSIDVQESSGPSPSLPAGQTSPAARRLPPITARGVDQVFANQPLARWLSLIGRRSVSPKTPAALEDRI